MLVHHWASSSIRLAGTHLYTWVEGGTVRVNKCLPQEHNTMFTGRALTQTAPSRHKHNNHEATVPPTEYTSARPENIPSAPTERIRIS